MEKLNWNRMKEKLENSGQAFDPASNAKRRVDNYNETYGKLTGYDCPKCRNRGDFARLREDLTLYYVDCECKDMRLSLERLRKSGLSRYMEEYSFANYRIPEDWQRRLKQGVMDYSAYGEGWLLISGPSGIGKTHLCTAVCRERILRYPNLRYIRWQEEIRELKTMDYDDPKLGTRLEELKKAHLLYIDDLFKNVRDAGGRLMPTQAELKMTFEILDYRYCNKLPTILSTELTPNQLLQIDEALGSRIIERSKGHAYVISGGRERNYRLKTAREAR